MSGVIAGCVAHPAKARKDCVGCGRMLGPFWWRRSAYVRDGSPECVSLVREAAAKREIATEWDEHSLAVGHDPNCCQRTLPADLCGCASMGERERVADWLEEWAGRDIGLAADALLASNWLAARVSAAATRVADDRAERIAQAIVVECDHRGGRHVCEPCFSAAGIARIAP